MYDAIVLGLGGMGSATLYHLAASGSKVLGLEQFGIPHAYGSSHGSTRIIRLAYSEGNEYVPLLKAAYRYWRELEELSGRRILHVTGGLDIGQESSWTVSGSRASCQHHGLRFEELTGSEVNRRFPGYSLPDSMRAIFQPDGGYVRSEIAIETYVAAARGLGAETLTDVEAVGWSRRSGGIAVSTTRGEFECKRLAVTAGAWIGGLVPPLREHCRPERQVMLWTCPLVPEAYKPDRFPVFNMEASTGRFYGFPDHGSEGFKIGKYHHLGEDVDRPEDLERNCGTEDEAVLRAGIREYFPGADGPARRMAACMFTNTPDDDFVIDRCPGEEAVFLAAGFSGHGFKFCSVVGKVMAELCLDRQPVWDISRFRLTAERTRAWRSRPRRA